MGTQIDTKQGKVNGRFSEGIFAFLGIPYAEAPTGNLRFRPPVSRKPWSGVYDATSYGPSVPQSTIEGILGEISGVGYIVPSGEDSLNLNVWTPNPDASGLPVLVWIHGGGFRMGSGSDPVINGSAFARDGVVCVTINYRLGSQGFLYLEGEEGAGNFGILDQICALKWVQENIASFGGDPSRVTVGGQSAGAMSVATLMATPSAKGLFCRAIVQSNAAISINTQTAGSVAAYLAHTLDVDLQDYDPLRAIPSERLIEADNDTANRALSRQEQSFGDLLFAALPAAFEPVHGTKTLPSLPIEAIRQGSAEGVDVLIGTTAEEDLALMKGASEAFGITLGEDIPVEVLEGTAQLIFGRSPVSAVTALELYRKNRPHATNLELMCAMQTDWLNRIPTLRLAEAQLQHNASVYNYQLCWKSNNPLWGAGHVLDVPLVFDTCDTKVGTTLTGGNVPQQIIDSMHGAWVEFIKTGTPSQQNLPEWPAYNLGDRPTMILDTEPRIVHDLAQEERVLWSEVL